jgi:hypothetical protein
MAFDHGVRSEKRKSVEVLFDGLNRCLPTLDGVAFRAIGAKLAAMNVRVAIGAVFTDIGEDRLEVARRAIDLFVLAVKRVFRGVVIEFGNGA